MKTSTLAVLMLLGTPALAKDAPKPEPKPATPDTLKDRYGFNMLNSPSKEKCVRVDDKLLKELRKSYTCAAEENTQSASGQPNLLCKRKDEKKQYALFKTKALCDEERTTQAANGEEG